MKKLSKLFSTILILSLLVIPVSVSAQNVFETLSLDQKVDYLVKDKEFDANSILIVDKEGRDTQKFADKSGFRIKSLGNSTEDNNREIKPAETDLEKNKIKEELKNALKNPKTKYAQPNYLYKPNWTVSSPDAKPSDFSDTNHWYYLKENVSKMWFKQGCPSGTDCGGKSNVIVAVLDTGLAFENYNDAGGFTNKSFSASSEYSGINLWTNVGEVDNDGLDNDCNGVVDDRHGVDLYALYSLAYLNTCPGGTPTVAPTIYKKAGHPVDTYGHGSFVTGLIASAVDNGGSVSPAFNVSLMSIASSRHTTNTYYSYFTTTTIAEGIRYAYTYGADVLNMSLGYDSNDTIIESEINTAIANDVVVVAASGNDSSYGLQPVSYPAANNGVIAVGALNSNDSRSVYSNVGNNLSVVAYVGDSGGVGSLPYQHTLTCFPCNKDSDFTNLAYKTGAGTSFASPQIAALAGLIRSKNENLRPYQVKSIIEQNARDVGATGFDTATGFGVIDFEKTLDNTPTDSTVPVYRFFNRVNGNHHFTISDNEKTYISNNIANAWNYEGIGYLVYEYLKSGTTAIYRFHNKVNDEHFFTTSTAERDYLDAHPDWENEGIAFYAYPNSVGGSIPVFRLLNSNNGLHLYTTDVNEKTVLINSNEWIDDGTQYHVDVYTGETTVETFRFFDPNSNMHFFTPSIGERNYLLQLGNGWSYEGVQYYVHDKSQSGSVAAYRFRKNSTGAHIYTANAGEKSYLESVNSGWTAEGIGYYIHTSQEVGTMPVYRFRHKTNGDYIFSMNVEEIGNLLQSTDWVDEGVQYYGFIR